MSINNEKRIEKILHELVRYADSLLSGMTPEKKLDWLKNKDARRNLFEEHPECFLPIKQMDAMNFQPFFIVCNRTGTTDLDMVRTAINLCKKLVNNKTVCQIELTKTLKKLIRMYTSNSGISNKSNPMAYSNGKATNKLNSVLNGMQSQTR